MKRFIVLFTVLLVISITPLNAVIISQNNSNDTDNLERNISSLEDVSGKIQNQNYELKGHIATINYSADYIKDNWWKFWRWGNVNRCMSTIQTESQILKDISNDIGKEAQKANKTSEMIENQLNKEDNSKTDANKMAEKLKDHFNVFFIVSEQYPFQLNSGDIIQLKTKNGYYRYLIFDKIDNSTGLAYFNGSSGKIISVPKEELSNTVQHKLKPNYPGFDGSKAVKQAYLVQKEYIDQKLNEADSIDKTSNVLLISSASIAGVVIILGVVDVVLWAIVFVTIGASAVAALAVTAAIVVLSAAAASLGIAGSVLGIQAKDLRNSAQTELDDLNYYNIAEIPPVAENMTLKAESGKEITSIFNASNINGDALVPNVVDEPTNGSISILDNKSFIYKSEDGFMGNDTFSYRVKDPKGLYSNIAWVKIEVLYNNTINTTAQNLTYTTFKEMPLDMKINTKYNISIVKEPAHGSASIVKLLEISDYPTIKYQPSNGYIGKDFFSYQLIGLDGKKSNIAWINIEIKDKFGRLMGFINSKSGNLPQ